MEQRHNFHAMLKTFACCVKTEKLNLFWHEQFVEFFNFILAFCLAHKLLFFSICNQDSLCIFPRQNILPPFFISSYSWNRFLFILNVCKWNWVTQEGSQRRRPWNIKVKLWLRCTSCVSLSLSRGNKRLEIFMGKKGAPFQTVWPWDFAKVNH